MHITIIYEDFASGLRAKRFADLLAERCGTPGASAIAMWRCELLEITDVAAEAAGLAEAWDYLIVSLSANRTFSDAVREWITSRLGGCADGGGVILLATAGMDQNRVAVSVRQGIKSICVERGVPFFGYSFVPGLLTNAKGDVKPPDFANFTSAQNGA